MKDSYLVIPLQAKYIEFGIWIVVLLSKFIMLKLIKPRVHKEENENLKDVRGIQLLNAMKNMDVGELRSRQLNDKEDDQVQVLSNSNVQVDTNQASTSGSHDNMQDQQVASTSSQPNDQASASNVPILQPTNIARNHLLNTIIGDISRGMQTRSRLALF